MPSLKNVLSFVPAYVGLQKVVGADRLRHRSIAELGVQRGDTVIDVGCGPAYYLNHLPQKMDYHGFDTDAGYIKWATQRWVDRGTFHLGIFDEAAAKLIPQADAIMLLGLLHHLSDEESRDLLALCARILSPGGRVVSVDTCFEPTQGRISRWMSDNDRGEFVRRPDEFVALAEQAFGEVEGDVVNDATRVPGSYWLMRLSAPVTDSVSNESHGHSHAASD